MCTCGRSSYKVTLRFHLSTGVYVSDPPSPESCVEVLYLALEKPGGGPGDGTSRNNSPLTLAQIVLPHWLTGPPVSIHNEGSVVS